jgi:hypothetical protein
MTVFPYSLLYGPGVPGVPGSFKSFQNHFENSLFLRRVCPDTRHRARKNGEFLRVWELCRVYILLPGTPWSWVVGVARCGVGGGRRIGHDSRLISILTRCGAANGI